MFREVRPSRPAIMHAVRSVLMVCSVSSQPGAAVTMTTVRARAPAPPPAPAPPRPSPPPAPLSLPSYLAYRECYRHQHLRSRNQEGAPAEARGCTRTPHGRLTRTILKLCKLTMTRQIQLVG